MDRDLWHCTGGSDQDHPQEKEMQKAKCLSEKALQTAEKKKKEREREKQKAKDKKKDIPIWMQSSKEEQGEIRKPSSVISVKK